MGILFDTSSSALRFALNHRDDSMKPAAPIMNTMLYAASHQENAQAPTLIRRTTPLGDLTKLEKTLQAGIILNFLATLADEQQAILVAKFRNPRAVCNCSNPCCSGFRKDKDWKEALATLARLLTEKAETDRTHGRKGFKTHAPMMVRILERAFDPMTRLTVLNIAEVCDVTPATVAAHGKHIGATLDDWRKDGLMALDYILVHEGIVGAL